MQLNTKILKVVFALTFTAGCSRQAVENSPAPNPRLPESWYKIPEKTAENRNTDAPTSKPDPQMDATVHTTFRAHSQALAELTPYAMPELNDEFALLFKSQQPVWRLDGMVADFAISAGGLFGPLLMKGTASVSGTWQFFPAPNNLSEDAQALNEGPQNTSSSIDESFSFTADMNAQDLDKMLEPAIRSAVATETVGDEKSFRQSLRQQGQGFLKMVQLLDRLPDTPEWYIGGYQLQLAFSAKGVATPVGGTETKLKLRFDWRRPPKETNQNTNKPQSLPALSREDAAIFQGLSAFMQTMGSIIPEALTDSKSLRDSGFALTEYRTGIGMSIGGDVGIALGKASVLGKIIFKANPKSVPETGKFAAANDSDKVAMIRFAGSESTDSSFNQLTDNGDVVIKVEREKFRDGLKHALNMGSYFAKTASSEETSGWRLVKVETKFESSLSGNFKLVTVSDHGQTELVFERLTSSVSRPGGNMNLVGGVPLNTELDEYFARKFQQVQTGLIGLENAPRKPTAESHAELRKISFSISPSVTFGISGVLNLSVAPEVGFVLVPAKAN